MSKGYKATRDADGVLTIANVPIFVECEKGETKFGRKWIKDAVKAAQLAAKDGYYPPLHIRHHEMATELNDSVRPAGFFKITKAREISFKGEKKLAVFADLVITDDRAEYEVLQKRLPYRSVEIFDVGTPALNSLALLDHEAPYLELPMLLVDEVIETDANGERLLEPLHSALFANAKTSNPWVTGKAKRGERVVACFRRGTAAVILTQETDIMADQTLTVDVEDEQDVTATQDNVVTSPEETVDDAGPQGENLAADGAPFERKDGGEGSEKDDSEGAAMDSNDPDSDGDCSEVGAVVQAIADGSISIADFAAIREAMAQQEGADPQQPQQPQQRPVGATPAPAAAPGGGEAMSKMTKKEMALQGRVDALEAKDAERDAQEARKTAVDAAMSRLSDRPVGANFREKLEKMFDSSGAEGFALYVDSFAETFGAKPETGDAAERFGTQPASTSAAVMKYQGSGTEAMSAAAQFSAEWTELSSRGGVTLSEERYVQINMARKGFQEDAPTA